MLVLKTAVTYLSKEDMFVWGFSNAVVYERDETDGDSSRECDERGKTRREEEEEEEDLYANCETTDALVFVKMVHVPSLMATPDVSGYIEWEGDMEGSIQAEGESAFCETLRGKFDMDMQLLRLPRTIRT